MNPKKKSKEWEVFGTIRWVRYYCDLIWNAGLKDEGDKLTKYKNEIEERIKLLNGILK